MSQKELGNQVTVESSRHHHTELELHATDQESQSLSRDAITYAKTAVWGTVQFEKTER